MNWPMALVMVVGIICVTIIVVAIAASVATKKTGRKEQ